MGIWKVAISVPGHCIYPVSYNARLRSHAILYTQRWWTVSTSKMFDKIHDIRVMFVMALRSCRLLWGTVPTPRPTVVFVLKWLSGYPKRTSAKFCHFLNLRPIPPSLSPRPPASAKVDLLQAKFTHAYAFGWPPPLSAGRPLWMPPDSFFSNELNMIIDNAMIALLRYHFLIKLS